MLQSLPVRLSLGQAAQADGPGVITPPELQLALGGSNRGTAPGPDGLPVEFYLKGTGSRACRVISHISQITDAIDIPALLG
jgi:hypothetical protein